MEKIFVIVLSLTLIESFLLLGTGCARLQQLIPLLWKRHRQKLQESAFLKMRLLLIFGFRNGLKDNHGCRLGSKLVESYISLGSDIVEPFSPPPFKDNDLEDVKRRSAGRFTIIGNIDQENILKKADTETIRKVTKETVAIGKVMDDIFFKMPIIWNTILH